LNAKSNNSLTDFFNLAKKSDERSRSEDGRDFFTEENQSDRREQRIRNEHQIDYAGVETFTNAFANVFGSTFGRGLTHSALGSGVNTPNDEEDQEEREACQHFHGIKSRLSLVRHSMD
jgi:hypothetical protein